jgi:hypothetical protein
MKKRAQLPDAKTFTIIFRGCARSDHPKLAVAEAIRLYHTMLIDKRLQPNSIHLNAVIQVCARAGDIDSMFSILSTADEKARSPSAFTYTSIFNALRAKLERPGVAGVDREQVDQEIKQTIQRCQSIWEEVVSKWRSGKVVIDEELVCSLGRVLLLGDRSHNLQILDLIEQTMCIPKLDISEKSLLESPGNSIQLDQDITMKNLARSGPSKKVPNTSIVYATPGRNTLSLVLTAMTNVKRPKIGYEYWNLFIDHYGTLPDSENWHRMLRMLRVSRSSALSADMLLVIPHRYIAAKTFRIALSTCLRDNMNPNAVTNARKMVDTMVKMLKEPDLLALRTYVRIAVASHHQFRQAAKNGDLAKAKAAYGRQIATALQQIFPIAEKLCNNLQLQGTADPNIHSRSSKSYNDQREIVALLRKMVAAYDQVVSEEMLPESELRPLRLQRNVMNRSVLRFYEDRERREPQLKKCSKYPTLKDEDEEIIGEEWVTTKGF